MKMSMAFLAVAVVAVHATDNSGENRDGEAAAEQLQDPPAEVTASSLTTPWGWSLCVDAPCKLGEGDCDSDAECKEGLVCGHNNCRAMHPKEADQYPKHGDCCEVMKPFHFDYCMLNPGCGFGYGDCDDDAQCGEGLVCGTSNCRAMHPNVDPVTIHHRADCCTTCAAVTAVQDDIGTPQPPMAFVSGKLTTKHRTISNPPSILESSVAHSLPPLASGDAIKLECCSKKKTPCNFFVAVYHCPPCSRHQNGGIPAFLASNFWQGASCAPIFTPAGSSQAQTMTVFQKTFSPGEKLTIPLSADAPHVAVFSTTGEVGEWCPRHEAKGTTGPNKPCVCLV